MVRFSSAGQLGPDELDRNDGRLTVRVLGTPVIGAGDVTLTGPGVHVRLSRRGTVLGAARPGRWEVVAGRVRAGGDTFFPVTQTVRVNLSAGAAGVVTVDYADEVPNHLLVVSPGLLLGPAGATSSGCPIKGAKAYIFGKGDLLKYFETAHDIAIGIGPGSPNGFLWSTNFAKCPIQRLSGGRAEVWETGDAPLSVLPSGELPASRLRGTISALHQTSARKVHGCGKGTSVSLKASLAFHPTWSMAVDWSFTQREFTAKASLGGKARAVLDATATANASCSPWTTDLLGRAKDLGRFEVKVGPVPVVVVPKLTLPATVTATVRAAASIQVAENVDATARGSWGGKKLVTTWHPPHPTGSIENKTLGTTTSLTATVGPQIEFAIYGILGPSVDIQGAAELNASPAGYGVCIGVQAGVTLDFHLFKPFSTTVSVGTPGDLATHYWKLTGNQPCPGKWTASSPPIPGAGNQGSIDSVACTGIQTCIAVGSYGTVAGTGEPLVDTHSDGAWTAVTPPVPAGGSYGDLNDVFCTSAHTCVAVGDYDNASGRREPLSDTYSDGVWTATTPPLPAGGYHSELTDVSCTATNTCVAVGDYDNSSGDGEPLVDTYSHGAWTAASPPVPAGGSYGYLNSVFCTTTGTCIAVGDYSNSSGGVPLAETYSHGAWTAASPPAPAGSNDSYLSDVSCTAAGTCVAVGSYDNTNPVGDPMVDTYSDGAWTLTTPPVPAGAGFADLQNGSCSTAGTCVAVGSYINASYNLEPLGYTYADGAWTATTPPEPAGGKGSVLYDVACTAHNTCVAVGVYGNTSPGEQPLIDTYSNGAWTATAAPEPASGEGYLGDVACTATGTCVAIGSYDHTTNELLADTYTPSR
jgi:hypothetical protein